MRINDKMLNISAQKARRAPSNYTDPKTIVLGATYKPDTYDQRKSPAQEIMDNLPLDGYNVIHYDSNVKGRQYDDLIKMLNSEDTGALLQLVPHENVLADVADHQKELEGMNITLLQFGTGNPIDPTENEE